MLSSMPVASPGAASPVSARLAAVQSAMDARTAHYPGMGIIVGYIDPSGVRILVSGSAGTSRPLDVHTRFEVGSVTKTFTANVLAQDVLAGRVKLSDPVAKYLPKSVRVPSRNGKQITLLNLATQHSGLPRMPTNMSDVAGNDPYADYTIANMYAFISGYRLTRDPGAQFEYSNLGVGLLGQALANQAHTTYADTIRTKVYAPLQMTESTVATKPEHDAALAIGHDLNGTPTHSWEIEGLVGAGAVRSTMHDMLNYLRCNMGSGPLARTCMFAQQPRDTFPGHKIGLIWWLKPDGAIDHGGDTAGFHAIVAMSADHKRGVVVLGNGPVVTDIGMSLVDDTVTISSCPAGAAPIAGNEFAGSYCSFSTGIGFVIAGADADHLTVQVPGQPAVALSKSTADHYAAPALGVLITFARSGGHVVGIRFAQSGQMMSMPRIDASGHAAAMNLSLFPPAIALTAVALQQYAGVYDAGSGLAFTVKMEHGGLNVMLTGQPFIAVYASAVDQFFYKVVDAQITFTRDGSGRVTGLVLHQDGRDLPAHKTR